MAHMSSPWRALRPALLAGAAAVTWLTLSSTAASADAGPDSSSLIGGVTSSVSSLTHDLADAASPAPLSSPAGPAATPGLLQPMVTQVSGLADNLIASVPAVDQVLPAGTVSTVSAPLVDVADGVTSGVVQVVVEPAAEAVPALEPVLQPVSDLLTGAAPLPVPLPQQGVELQQPLEAVQAGPPATETPAPAAAEASAGALQAATDVDQDALALADASSAASGAIPEARGAAGLAGTSVLQSEIAGLGDSVADEPLPVGPAPLTANVPAAPGSGTGSGTSSGGPSSAAAWLSTFDVDFILPCAVLAGDTSEHLPAPVSFDPGSSPD
ncbi:hypothetical protein [Arthrobacter sp. FW306-07-I]|uniref:hypothetical protein n=1 Tax=Arthrobacter sp. FW306-07-I TaxID=2879622 RepID=UPI001F16F2C3|nr:hypothetical protein [Arthrobacter sp. FW306-07-I]UKA76600.1 hypothetical protein LFT46_05970 [Arthrobacter sp. FW306-07-I]